MAGLDEAGDAEREAAAQERSRMLGGQERRSGGMLPDSSPEGVDSFSDCDAMKAAMGSFYSPPQPEDPPNLGPNPLASPEDPLGPADSDIESGSEAGTPPSQNQDQDQVRGRRSGEVATKEELRNEEFQDAAALKMAMGSFYCPPEEPEDPDEVPDEEASPSSRPAIDTSKRQASVSSVRDLLDSGLENILQSPDWDSNLDAARRSSLTEVDGGRAISPVQMNEEIKGYAEYLGVDIIKEKHLAWIAEDAVEARAPHTLKS